MEIFHKVLNYQTEKKFQFIDATEDVRECVKESGIKKGIVVIYTPHTTTAVKINESEDGFMEDFREAMGRLVPVDQYYRHNNLDIRAEHTLCEDPNLCINGDSHILQMLLGTSSETIPVDDGRPMLGRWQCVFLIELDKKRDRRLEVRVMGVGQ